MTTMTGNHITPWRIAGWSLIAVLLALPAVAMRFTAEVVWTPFDFVAAVVMLGALGGGLELIARLSAGRRIRVALAVGSVALFLLIWAELAVGIFS